MLLNKEINVRDELSNFIPWYSSMDKSTDYTLSHTHWYGKMLMTQKKFESYVDLMIADSIINLLFDTFYEEDELEDLYSDMFEIVSKWEEYQQCDEISWGVPKEAYLECMEDCLSGKVPYDWYLCMDKDQIVAGMGVIENDFHDRKDLTPNVCAVYTEDAYRCKGLAGKLLNMVVDDMNNKGITPIYLISDHIGFYEKYGWEFLCMVQGDGEPEKTRMYVHR